MTPLDQVLSHSRLPGLHGLRALFVAMVVLYHGGFLWLPGDLGVTGFFVLSGFLITWLLLKEQAATGTVSRRDFYIRRSLRIFPAYFVFVGCAWGFDIIQHTPWTSGELLSALTYTVNYDNAFTGNHPIAHAWSLAVEEQFYLVWPALFGILFSRGALVRGLCVVIALVLVWRSWLYAGADLGAGYVYHAFDTRFDALATGCLTAALCTDERFTRGIAPRLARRAWFPLLAAAGVLLSRTYDDLWHYTIGMTVENALLAVLMLQMLQLAGSGVWASLLENRVAVWLGTVSYSIYLWHGWGLVGTRRGLPDQNVYVVLAAGVLMCVLLAAGSYYVIELPFLRLKKRFTAPAARPESAQAEVDLQWSPGSG